MLPHEHTTITLNSPAEWVKADGRWFDVLVASNCISVAEKVHLARLSIQQQWVCDVVDSPDSRLLVASLGLHIALVNSGYLIITGNKRLADHIEQRDSPLTTLEVGLLYGYPASAVLAFAEIIEPSSPQPWPRNSAEYFMGGAYSGNRVEQERRFYLRQWSELQRKAPHICAAAEAAFANISDQASDAT